MCIYIYIYVYLHVYIHIYTYMHIYIYVYLHTCDIICMHRYITIHVYTYIYPSETPGQALEPSVVQNGIGSQPPKTIEVNSLPLG